MCRYCWPDVFPDHRERNVYREEDEYETPYRKKGKSKKSVKKMPGCSGNDGGSHIYVWVIQHYPKTRWVKGDTVNERGYRNWVPVRDGCYENYRRVCVGCGQRQPGKWGFGRTRKNTIVYDETCDYGCKI